MMTSFRTSEMLKNLFLFATVFLMTILGFHGGASASTNYSCRAENIGYTDKINIEFPYQEGAQSAIQNLYITVTKVRGGESQIWDALYSTDGDYSYWTTPVLRDVSVGTAPLVIIRENGLSDLIAFFGEDHPIQCTVR
jgi:hypothetical protein